MIIPQSCVGLRRLDPLYILTHLCPDQDGTDQADHNFKSIFLKERIRILTYRQTSNIRRIKSQKANKIVDHSDVVGASPVGAVPTTSSIST